MIVGLGIDLVELDRVARAYSRFGAGFAKKILHEEELDALPGGARTVPYLAARFAAKEAAVKALGTGFRGGIWFQSFCVKSVRFGAPSLVMHGAALEAAARLEATRIHLSLTHGRDTAAAVVILEKE